MVNTKIILIILFAAKDGEALYSQCKDYENAAQVLSAIIRQHETVRKLKQEYLSEEDFRKHQERWEPVTAHFRELLDMTRRCDDGEIRKWLEQNYAVNADYAKFCMK